MADTPHNVLVLGAALRESATDLRPGFAGRSRSAQRNLCSL
jgi:hypothetical protein